MAIDFAKLAAMSRGVFQVEVTQEQKDDLDRLMYGVHMESPRYFAAKKLRERIMDEWRVAGTEARKHGVSLTSYELVVKAAKGWIQVGKLGVEYPDPADVNIYGGRPLPYGDAPPGMIAGQLGNPYKSGGRDYNVARFQTEFQEGKSDRAKVWRDAAEWIFREARAGKTVRLWCHCKPLKCHLDVIQHEALTRLVFPETPFTPYSWEPQA